MKPSERAQLVHHWKLAVRDQDFETAKEIEKKLKNAVMEPESPAETPETEPAELAPQAA